MRIRTLVAIWSVPAWYTALNDQATVLLTGGTALSWREMLSPLAEWYLWVPVTPCVLWLANRYPITAKPSWRTILVHLTAIVAIAVLRGVVYVETSITFAHGSPLLWRGIVFYLPFAAALYAVIVAIDRITRLQTQLARAELTVLRANLQPHFLFNALHTVGALVRARDHDGAVHVITELGDLLRAVLRRDAPEEVTLRDELAFVERYLAIEQVRFRDRLHVRWDVSPDTVNAVIPRLLLQPLAENAIRHGIGGLSTAGMVTITAAKHGDVLEVAVIDDGPGPNGHGRAGGLGLATARARLKHAYGQHADVTLSRGTDGGAVALARLPFRHA
jgi:two-component system, LytTR family, sensor kinase